MGRWHDAVTAVVASTRERRSSLQVGNQDIGPFTK
jgi:hypothetical protein